MTTLDTWINQATRCLSNASASQVHAEIHAHYESARETALANGATADQASHLAVAALGDAKVANRQYRQVLLTSAEARLLRESQWEARAVCSRPWLKSLLLAMPAAALLAALACFLTGSIQTARVLLVAGTAMGLMFAAPFLPLYTRSRARAFRLMKWTLLTAAILIAIGPDAFRWSWLMIVSAWPIVWIEWTRARIRRKLNLADWPKHLYL